jgi:DNA-binding LacI/PurR family transcriptional regulator
VVSADQPKARVANIFDVARLAGVSPQTVSRVVNSGPNVRPATRQRVEDAILQLRYRPSTAARALVTRRSRTIGLITTGRLAYGPSSILLAFNDAARQARYAVSISSMVDADAESMRSSVEQLLGQNVEAIVLLAGHRSALDAMQTIDLGTPLVAVDSSGRPGFHSVSIDQFAGARAATDYLVGLGHRNILHVAGPDDSVDAIEREQGWRASLSEHGLVALEPLVTDWSPSSGFRIGLELLNGPSFTAVFAGNDETALGLIHAFRDNGLSVPGDVSVVGFDDIPEAEHFDPPLTTVRQDFAELGTHIMSTLEELLRDGEDDVVTPQLAPTLIERSSASAPIGQGGVPPRARTRTPAARGAAAQ